jgi:phage terminase large subunit
MGLAVDYDERILYVMWEYYSCGKTDQEIGEDIKEFIDIQELIKSDNAESKAIWILVDGKNCLIQGVQSTFCLVRILNI